MSSNNRIPKVGESDDLRDTLPAPPPDIHYSAVITLENEQGETIETLYLSPFRILTSKTEDNDHILPASLVRYYNKDSDYPPELASKQLEFEFREFESTSIRKRNEREE